MLLAASRRNGKRRRAGGSAAAVAAVGVLVLAAAASAEPPIEGKRREAAAVLAQVQELDEQVGAAAERYNGARYRLGLLSGQLQAARVGLTRARTQLGVARDRAATRLVELYVNGRRASALEIMLGATSLRDAIDTIAATERISDQDARIANELRRLAAKTKERKQRLQSAQATQRRLVGRLAAERDAIATRLEERQALLDSIRAEVQRLEAEERARQVELRRRAEAELARQRRLASAQSTRAEAPEPPETPEQASGDSTATAFSADPPPAPPADASRGAQVVAIAMRYLGVPYKWGGASPSTGFDCSGFTMYVFAQIGVSLPHYAAAQYQMGRPVAKSELAPGDLVFFRGLGHMGMYIGGGNFIHSPQTGDVVKISSLSEPYRVANWVGARRIL